MPLSPEDQKLLDAADQEFAPPPGVLPGVLQEPKKLPKGGKPTFGLAPSTGLKEGQAGAPRPGTQPGVGLEQSWYQQQQAYPGWTGTALRALTPGSRNEVLGTVLGGTMFGPEAKGALGAVRAMTPMKKLLTMGTAGALSSYGQGQSPLGGAAQLGAQALGGRAGEKIGGYLGQKAAGRAAKETDAPTIAQRMVKSAPWLQKIIPKHPSKWTHEDINDVFQGTTVEPQIQQEFRNGLDMIVNEADQLFWKQNPTLAGLHGNQAVIGSKAMAKVDPQNAGRLVPVREMLDTVAKLRDRIYLEGIQQRTNTTAAYWKDVRRELIDEIEEQLNNWSGGKTGTRLGDSYTKLRKEMGRTMATLRLGNFENVTTNTGRVAMDEFEKRLKNRKTLGLDIENWLDKPGEWDDWKRVFFRGGDPTITDVPGKSGGMHVYATAALKPHGYFKLGTPATYAGAKANQASGLAGAYATGRGIGGLKGEWNQKQPQQVLTPDQQEQQGGISAGGDIPPDLLEEARQAHPGVSDAEIIAAYNLVNRRGR